MTTSVAAKADHVYELATAVCRKISTKQDEDAGFSTYVGQAPVASFLDLPDHENVREYIPGSNQVKQRRSEVHQAIADTLRDRPASFSALNGGIVIVASKIEMLEDQKRIRLKDPSIINGSQTRGEIIRYLQALKGEPSTANVKFEIIVTTDEDLIADISIARNFQEKVKAISIYGKKGLLDDLEKACLDKTGKRRRLRLSETDRDDEIFIPTEKLIQVITALIPEQLWKATGRPGEYWNKAFAYSSTNGPLKLFATTVEKARDKNDPIAAELNQFYLDMASEAWALYELWATHPGFNGTNLKHGYGLERDDKGNVCRVYDGMIFPIIAAFSVFVEKKNGKWVINPPENWRDEFLIQQAKRVFVQSESNPQTMGKTASSYSSLNGISSMARLMG